MGNPLKEIDSLIESIVTGEVTMDEATGILSGSTKSPKGDDEVLEVLDISDADFKKMVESGELVKVEIDDEDGNKVEAYTSSDLGDDVVLVAPEQVLGENWEKELEEVKE